MEPLNAVYADFASEKKLRILHVDNDAAFLAVAARCLEEQGAFQVDMAFSADEALEKLRNADYDVVVADYQMPEKNGLELLKEMREEGIAVPFILFTCKGKAEIAIEALNSGVEQYVDKQGNAEATYEELKHSILRAVRRRRTEKQLRESESLLRQITENIQDMLIVTDEKLAITCTSASLKNILGYTPSEVMGKHVYQFIHPDDLTKTMDAVQQAFKERSGGKLELRVKSADGGYVLLEGVTKVLTDDGNNVTGIIITSRDVTEQRKTEQTLKDSEEKYRRLFEEATDAIFIADFETGILIDCNNAAAKLIGRPKSELIGMHQRFLHPEEENGPEFGRVFEKHRSDSEGQIVEDHIITKNGEVRDVTIKPSLIELNGRKIVQGIFRDITEQKRAEQALSKSEEKYRKLFEEALDAIFVADAETGVLVDCNRAATKLVGRSKSEIIGMHQRFLHPPEEIEGEFSRTFKQHRRDKEGFTVETQIITKNGEIRDVAIKANLFEVDGKKMLLGLFRDITESKRMSEKAYFQARLLNAVGQAIIATDIAGNIIYWNKAAEQLYGWSEDEVLGRNVEDITPTENSKEQAAVLLNRLLAGENWSGEFVAKRRDGTSFSAIVTDAPIFNDKGEVIGIISISTDISEQKWMQEVFDDAIGKVAELNEKLQVVGSLSRHDIRNKLATLNGRLFLLKKRLSGNTEALNQLREMEEASQQILRILEFERIYEQVGAEELTYIDAEKHLNEAVSLFSDLKGAELINECHGLMVLADSLLRQVFYNLIDNTLKYGEKTSKIRIYYVQEKDKLKLIYEDNGVGIPDEVKKNLFKEGFGRGTGYGLYLMKRICEAYGWTIEETGKHGRGAQFTMTIPGISKDGRRGYEIS
ncbi:MAG: PAS domain S-box protein [Candidatus Bathyarchaeota archaeon]|nr:PAS domain S-box protein [Candidatus Bathyarchaeota archaeon]